MLYDCDNRRIFSADIPFYRERAKKSGGHVLELACGTGRITIPLAEAGINIQGLDYSESMLEVLEEKVRKQPQIIRSYLRFVHGDMRDFALPDTFKLIFIAFRSFQSLKTDEEAQKCLACVHKHMEDDGEFMINVFKPLKEMGDWWVNHQEQLDFQSTLETGEKVTRHSIRRAIDTERRLLYTDYIYRIYHHDGSVEALKDRIRLRYFYGDDLRGLLQNAGFKIAEEYGWYDGTPVDEGSEFIFVCQKA